MSEVMRADMNWEEAKATCDVIRLGLGQVYEKVSEVRGQILLLHDRKGWVALGYSTWRECVSAEFDTSYRNVYLELKAARIEQEIEQANADGMRSDFTSHKATPMEQERLPTSQLIALEKVAPSERREVIAEAKASSPNGKTTTKLINKAVDRKLGNPKPDPKPEAPRSQFKAEVNGQRAADPPDIAARRAAGKIGADVVVEVSEPDPEPELEQEATPERERSQSEDEWLAALPLSQSLSGKPLLIFQSDARRYFRLKPARDAVRHHNGVAGKGLRNDGEYFRRVSGFLKLADPRDWIKCTTPDNGGCAGTGEVEMIGECPKCRGRGYTIDNRRF